MIRYRSFLNSDPPEIANIWCRQLPLRGCLDSVTPELLERFVFVKQYFDHDGLILAFDEDQPVGFVHAGFGPNESGNGLSTDCGVTSLLMVAPHDEQATIAAELLRKSEAYLQDRGASRMFVGSIGKDCPFYLGFYGGSQLSGILASDLQTLVFFEAAGYHEVERRFVLQRQLMDFRPPVSRDQLRIRRTFRTLHTGNPRTINWWEANTFAQTEREGFALISLKDKKPIGTASFWHVMPLSHHWGCQAVGLLDLEISPDARRQGLGTFLMSEAMQKLQALGYSLVDVQLPSTDNAALRLVEKLGFEKIDESIVLQKDA